MCLADVGGRWTQGTFQWAVFTFQTWYGVHRLVSPLCLTLLLWSLFVSVWFGDGDVLLLFCWLLLLLPIQAAAD